MEITKKKEKKIGFGAFHLMDKFEIAVDGFCSVGNDIFKDMLITSGLKKFRQCINQLEFTIKRMQQFQFCPSLLEYCGVLWQMRNQVSLLHLRTF